MLWEYNKFKKKIHQQTLFKLVKRKFFNKIENQIRLFLTVNNYNIKKN